jgi:hypothetical protein
LTSVKHTAEVSAARLFHSSEWNSHRPLGIWKSGSSSCSAGDVSSHHHRISFRACYNDPTIPELVRNVFPPTPKARDSLDVNLQLKPDASYALQSGEFTFELPPRNHVSAAWLCAALATDVSYFPAE